MNAEQLYNALGMWILGIKLIRLNDQGIADRPPCEMGFQFFVTVDMFIADFKGLPVTDDERAVAIAAHLMMFSQVYRCPIGFQVMHSQHYSTREQVFYPEKGMTDIDLTFQDTKPMPFPVPPMPVGMNPNLN